MIDHASELGSVPLMRRRLAAYIAIAIAAFATILTAPDRSVVTDVGQVQNSLP